MRGSHHLLCNYTNLQKTVWQSASDPLEFLLLRGGGGDPFANKCRDWDFWLTMNTRIFNSSSPSDKRGQERKCSYHEKKNYIFGANSEENLLFLLQRPAGYHLESTRNKWVWRLNEAQLQNLALISGAPRYRVLRRRSGQDPVTTMHNNGWTNHSSGLVWILGF